MSLSLKYRSQKFGNLVGQDHIRDTLLMATKSDQIAQAYLFTGPRGTGKTSTARLIAKVANCLKISKSGEPCGECDSCIEIRDGKALDVIEIDGASNRGIDEIRALRENVRFAPSRRRKKVYIIDEVHMLTREAFNALLKTLEEPPNHLIFVLATTEAHKIPATIISRTQRFDFHRIKKSDIIQNLKTIAEAENIEIDDRAMDLIAVSAEGGHRDAITMLEQASSFSNKIEISRIESILGLAKGEEIQRYLRAIFNSQTEEGLKIAQRFYADGYQLNQIVGTIIEWLRKILLYLISNEVVFDDTEENIATIIELSNEIKQGDNSDQILLKMIDLYLIAKNTMKEATTPLLPIEIATIKAGSLINYKIQIVPNDKKEDRDLLDVKSEKIESKKIEEESEQVSVSVLEMAEDVWQDIITETKKINSTLSALLRDSKPSGISGDVLNLCVKFPFHRDKISETKNIKILEEAILRATGKTLRIVCNVADFKKKTREKISDDDLIKVTEEVFG